MSTPSQLGASLLKSLVKLREQKGVIRIEDLGEIMEEMASSLHPSGAPEQFLRNEFAKIADHIDQAKIEIASLIYNEGEENNTGRQHIGHATDQLDAVVKATEEATNQIMDSADSIQQAVEANAPDMKDTVNNAVAQIYLACNFQDITGQRITKVLNTLEYIDQKVRGILQLFGEVSDDDARKLADATLNSNEKRPDAALLRGPALPDEAPSQEDIDALFNSIR